MEYDSEIERELNKTVYYEKAYLYSWGRNDYGELGTGTSNGVNPIPMPVTSLINQEINFISVGGRHSLAITKENEILTCGSDLLGILGLDSFNWKNVTKFKKVELIERKNFIKIDCGEFHSLALTDEGNVYAWGGNLHNVSLILF